MLQNQSHLFNLPEDITYLNGAYMSPQLKSVSDVGVDMVHLKEQPFNVTSEHFFDARTTLRKRFAELISADNYEHTAIIPSVSYGMANVAQNCNLQADDEIILIDEQFPSNVYVWQHEAKKAGAKIVTVKAPDTFVNRGKTWNETILNAITNKTKVVSLAHSHWADGTLFNLKVIRKATHEVGAKLLIDGTQSVGALPFSIKEYEVDALVCGGYKWLLGPYGLGMAYYADSLCEGNPIEHNWMNRLGSEDFTNLVNYQDNYQPKAGRYSVGESSNFILTPMLTTAIDQLISWKPEHIQAYCRSISEEAVSKLKEKGCFIEDNAFRSHHLFGIYLPEHIDLSALKSRLEDNNVVVSFRGNAIRVSPNVYNTKEDFEKIVALF
jgi:selenocysteine lyase/cysteine desulfurase